MKWREEVRDQDKVSRPQKVSAENNTSFFVQFTARFFYRDVK